MQPGQQAIVCHSFYPFYKDGIVVRVGELVFVGKRYVIVRFTKKYFIFWTKTKDFIVAKDHVFEIIDDTDKQEVKILENMYKN